MTPAEGGALRALGAMLLSMGFSVERPCFSEAGTPDVENLYGRLGGVGPHLMFAGHTDVVPPGDEAAWTFPPFEARIARDYMYGRGAVDMKGGIAVMLAALGAFEASPAAAAVGYDVMINSDEETGSLSSAALIVELAQGKTAALTYEPAALPDGTLAHARGGSGNYSVVLSGRAAHAGRNPQDGRNAVIAAAALALELKVLETADLTVNPAKIDGGSANNVVPDHAVLRFNIRPRTERAATEFSAIGTLA